MTETNAAGGVVIGPQGLIVVVNQNGDSWSLPKGHIEKAETAQQAAEREIYEETGIKRLQYIKELGSYQRHRIGLGGGGEDTSELKTITIFMFTTKQAILQPVDPHHPEARWATLEEVAHMLTHPKDKLFFTSKLQEIQRFISP